jgi:uncharacterized protein
VLTEGPDGLVAEAVAIDVAEGLGFAARFRIACDTAWRVRRVEAGVVGDERRVELASDGAGHWQDGTGAPLPHLEGAIDVNLR